MWHVTGDPTRYAGQVLGLLAGDPVEHTIELTVIEGLRASPPEPTATYAWFERDGRVSGAARLTPPYDLMLAAVPDDAIESLADALVAARVVIPGALGESATVDRFATAWVERTGCDRTTWRRLRLYRLADLEPPETPGEPRLAGVDDAALVADWLQAFANELDEREGFRLADARHRIAAGLIWLWQDDGGNVVSLAGRRPAARGVARLAPVYTPPAERRRGYGAAVTAACAADARAREITDVVLFADLANDTTNRIYQAIGFRPVSDRLTIRFSALPGSPSQG